MLKSSSTLIVISTLYLSSLVSLSAAALSDSSVNVSEVDHQVVTIWSHGIRLEGDIYKPKGLKADDKLPGILMVPGWGGNKKNIEKNYAPHFAKKGFIVLSFDFKSWGQSDGPVVLDQKMATTDKAEEINVKVTHIRQIINPLSMVEDVRAALHFLGSEPQVMPNDLGIWGTSMGGGLALVAAANDDRVKALVSQLAPFNYKYNLRVIPDQQMRQVEAMVARGIIPPYPGPKSKVNPMLRGFPDWVAMKRFDPMLHVADLTAATLIMDVKDEKLFENKENGKLVYDSIKDRLASRYLTFPGEHYDMYKGDNLNKGRAEAIQWFTQYLQK
ncbi:alpha/beta hydrolase [Colwellia piezophila]|uniref:alpha/beta hydrolase n=1 Tax=Colwellia piezophila TaxID=211668 RepID=UPI000378945F|nr:alpha/beta fold hydrolase [Colwellia piezophila]